MDKEEIFEMVIREMTENALSCRRENLEEGEQQLYTEVGSLSSRAQDIVKELSEEKQKILLTGKCKYLIHHVQPAIFSDNCRVGHDSHKRHDGGNPYHFNQR